MHGELAALLIVILLLAGAAYSGMAARAKPDSETPTQTSVDEGEIGKSP